MLVKEVDLENLLILKILMYLESLKDLRDKIKDRKEVQILLCYQRKKEHNYMKKERKLSVKI